MCVICFDVIGAEKEILTMLNGQDLHRIQDELWVRCPQCYQKTRTKVYPDTVLLNFPLYCPKCKRETIINVVQLKMVISKEQNA